MEHWLIYWYVLYKLYSLLLLLFGFKAQSTSLTLMMWSRLHSVSLGNSLQKWRRPPTPLKLWSQILGSGALWCPACHTQVSRSMMCSQPETTCLESGQRLIQNSVNLHCQFLFQIAEVCSFFYRIVLNIILLCLCCNTYLFTPIYKLNRATYLNGKPKYIYEINVIVSFSTFSYFYFFFLSFCQ